VGAAAGLRLGEGDGAAGCRDSDCAGWLLGADAASFTQVGCGRMHTRSALQTALGLQQEEKGPPAAPPQPYSLVLRQLVAAL